MNVYTMYLKSEIMCLSFEVQELMQIVDQDPHEHKVLLGDWNAVRERDYANLKQAGTPVWDLFTRDFVARNAADNLQTIPTDALALLTKHEFNDSFTQAEICAQQWHDDYYAYDPDTAAAQIKRYGEEWYDAYRTEKQTKFTYPKPTHTVWTGRIVDFIFCSKDWKLPIDGSYVYYSDASDHLPVLIDILPQSQA